MITIVNETGFCPDEIFLNQIAAKLTDKNIELTFTDNATIQKINREHRRVDAPTDVLSFPLEAVPFAPMGEIIISVEFAAEEARRYGHSIHDEVALLFIHGLLHLLGYDHEIDDGEMRLKEEALICRFGLPESLIVRAEHVR